MGLSDAAWFVEEPPEITFRGGVFHIVMHIGGGCVFESVMPPSTYFVGLRRAVEAAKGFKFGGADVVPIKLPEEEDAA